MALVDDVTGTPGQPTPLIRPFGRDHLTVGIDDSAVTVVDCVAHLVSLVGDSVP